MLPLAIINYRNIGILIYPLIGMPANKKKMGTLFNDPLTIRILQQPGQVMCFGFLHDISSVGFYRAEADV